MVKNKTLPAIRIESNTNELIELAIKKLNDSSLVKLTLQDFRRICYEFTCRKIITGEKLQMQ